MFIRIRRSIEARFYHKINSMLIRRREAIERSIPKFDFQEAHIKKLKAVVNREELIRLMPKNGVVAEIGVFKGDFSEKILSESKPRRLHLIDAWSDARSPVSLMHAIEKRFGEQIISGVVEINRGWSTEVVNQFEDRYFDWIYLESDHSYGATILELGKFRNKIKKGGIVAGHDFVQGHLNMA